MLKWFMALSTLVAGLMAANAFSQGYDAEDDNPGYASPYQGDGHSTGFLAPPSPGYRPDVYRWQGQGGGDWVSSSMHDGHLEWTEPAP